MRALRAACFLGLALASCHGLKPEHPLVLKVDPPLLESGKWITVTAAAADGADLRYVSGTVKVLGAPVLPLRYDRKQRLWRYRIYIPDLVSIKAGKYRVLAWGQTSAGRKYEGSSEVKAP